MIFVWRNRGGQIRVVDDVKGLISNIERGSTLDGPGIRTVVFFKGCPLSCVWCHNPETIRPVSQPMWESRVCEGCGRCVAACPGRLLELNGRGMRFPFDACSTCAMPCVEACPNGALSVCGESMDAEKVLSVIQRDAMFYEASGGGVTFSGGEPLVQADFVATLAHLCRQQGIHTALDTSCHAPWPTVAKVLPWIDLLLCDVKVFDSKRHEELTGVPSEGILENLRRADAAGCRSWIRRPVVPGVNDSAEEIEATAAFAATLRNLERFELLPFNTVAGLKYAKIGQPFRLQGTEAPSNETMNLLQGILSSKGLPCST
jgi:pyruvate formate lyase activating enzyme